MKIACITAEGRGETDRLLSEAAAQLQADGRRLAGIVKVLSHQSSFANGCDMRVRVLPEGPEIAITQALGQGSDACRLDPGALAEAAARAENGALETAELFILNKFGPEEQLGRGFCPVIARAIEAGVPVLAGVGPAGRAAFDEFCGGMAETVEPEAQAISAWCRHAMR
jgi:hypothetical protein